MSELKLPRLLAAAKEFNIGQETLVEFLLGKGFGRDDLKPTARLSEDMYRSLQHEFQSDKVAKNKADLIEIPKGIQTEKRRREDEEITFKRDEKPIRPETVPAPVKEEPQPVITVAVEPEPVAVVEPEPVITEQTNHTPPPPAVESVPPVVEEMPAKTVEPEPLPEEQPSIPSQPENEPETMKLAAPEIEGLKIIDKIDLSLIDSSTRPKKTFKKKPEPEEEKKQKEEKIPPVEATEEIAVPVVPIPVSEPKAAIPETPQVQVEKQETVEEQVEVNQPVVPNEPVSAAPLIENIKARKLEGPKILGKIKLPVDNDTRPKPPAKDERRKRKRIPIDKKGNEGQTQSRSGQSAPQTGPAAHPSPQQRPIVPAQNRGGYQGRGGAPGGQGQGRGPGTGGPGGQGRFRPAPGAGGGAGRGDRRGAGVGRGMVARTDDKEIDQKEIQEKIRETQAKLAGSGGRGKSLKAKYRRAKREEAAEAMGDMNEDNKLQVTEFVTVSELANLMDVSFADVISKCMSLGIMVSINQRLDAEVIELVAGEFGYEVEFIGLEDTDEEEEEEEDDPEELVSRAPIVTIMGHVDHGKTSLLDYIRSANVVAGEAGGITQHIGAYQVTMPTGKKITFLDTPGHEAFTAMRARGAKVADIAVIVIAADDAVMPQTKEAISHAQAANVPMIFAINKIDKDGANPQKIYEQLSQMNILVEEWGGKYQSQEISAKKGINIDLLLEKILLEAELLDLKANPEREASGTMIEASLDKGRGYVATVLVQNGTLNLGDLMVSGQYYGSIKAMFNERNQRVNKAPPSTPVQILGLNGAPQAGEKFKVFHDEAEAKEVATKRSQIMREQGLRTRKHITLDEIGRRLALGNFKELNIIIKGDVDGSVEALSDSLQKLSTEEIAVNVVHKAVGQISESDVLLATASDAIVIGFNVRPSTQANRLAENEGVEIKMYSIIYNAIEEIRSAMEGMLEPKIQEKEVANVEIREVYKFDKATVAGCYVLDGKIRRDSKIRLFRDGILDLSTSGRSICRTW